VVLIGSHHAGDPVPVEGRVVAGDGGPEAADLEDHLRPVVEHEFDISGRLVVLPDVVGDGRADVPLEMRRIGQPTARERVEVDDLCLLPPVAPALPGVHRSGEAGLAGGPAGFRQTPVAVQEERPDQFREVKVQIGEDEQLVPEDVTAVGLTVQAAGGNADIEVEDVPRSRLEKMEDMEVEHQAGHVSAVLDLQRKPPPQAVPLEGVGAEQIREVSGASGQGACLGQRICRRPVPRGEEGHHLFDGDRLARLDVE
jgi:hypothetical protein